MSEAGDDKSSEGDSEAGGSAGGVAIGSGLPGRALTKEEVTRLLAKFDAVGQGRASALQAVRFRQEGDRQMRTRTKTYFLDGYFVHISEAPPSSGTFTIIIGDVEVAAGVSGMELADDLAQEIIEGYAEAPRI